MEVITDSNGDLYLGAMGATRALTVKPTGNVGIGTTEPAEKLDVAGNIKSNGLNKILFLRPLGPSSYDSEQINAAIAGLSGARGGIIMLEPGEYRINTTINLNVNGVKLRGYGGGWVNYPYEGAQATKLVWHGPSGSAVADPNKYPHQAIVECRWADTDTALQDLAISDLSILGNGRTNITGLLLDHVSGSIFRNVEITDVTEGIWLTSTATADNVDTDFNLFENCAVLNAQRGVVFTRNSDAAVNACHNTFLGLSIEYLGETASPPLAAGIHMVDCDNNSLYRTWIYRREEGGSQGYGVKIENPQDARANYFYHLQALPRLRVNNADLPFSGQKNVIFGYDMENLELEPEAKKSDGTPANADDFLLWIDSRGNLRGAYTSVLKAPAGMALQLTTEDAGQKVTSDREVESSARINAPELRGDTLTTRASSGDLTLTTQYGGNKVTSNREVQSSVRLDAPEVRGDTLSTSASSGDLTLTTQNDDNKVTSNREVQSSVRLNAPEVRGNTVTTRASGGDLSLTTQGPSNKVTSGREIESTLRLSAPQLRGDTLTTRAGGGDLLLTTQGESNKIVADRSLDCTGAALRLQKYTGSGFPDLSEHELALWYDGSGDTGFWLVNKTDGNKWKIQFTRVNP
jgi:hypothetical protein